MQLINLAAIALTAGSTAFAAPLNARAAAVDQLVGFGAGTTGGGSGSGTTVNSCSTFEAALKNGGVIKVNGKISGCGILKVLSNTSILGVGSSSGFSGTGLRLKDVSNVIIRNLEFNTAPSKGDIIDIESSTKVWLDHCDIHSKGLVGGKDDYDGLFDAKHGSDFITVSWTKFHDHWKGSLIGHSDKQTSDAGKLHITYHHNSFINVNSRLPSVRFGAAHVYSSCYQNNPTSGVNSRMGAKVLVEQNNFSNTPLSVVTDLDSAEEGFATERNNIFSGTSTTRITKTGAPTISYSYTADPAASVCDIVAKSGGVGVVTF
ncbi:polysaccharide lyase family 1 protein [Aaosphaeria arxii CBS 175.79]|uniref:Polysaccharide lyase family 1 protein n=1 Tax=Aaosphaeria arxii CBS 175.79 TaxID=1450172 RepID=A0A6A5XPR0_9PLEO|nr:polysaccharide lyase family 1 protein [Aaosphaeria arxii CBS 175.79]KAF2015132.1 polysaccharide lyase family 1 protein [Aaosphaeria arxii CBS 175.79]